MKTNSVLQDMVMFVSVCVCVCAYLSLMFWLNFDASFFYSTDLLIIYVRTSTTLGNLPFSGGIIERVISICRRVAPGHDREAEHRDERGRGGGEGKYLV